MTEREFRCPEWAHSTNIYEVNLRQYTIEGTINEDSGAMIRDGIKTVAKDGVCPETEWPYEITKFRDKPPQKAYDDAAKHQAILYQRLTQTVPQLKGCLAALGKRG